MSQRSEHVGLGKGWTIRHGQRPGYGNMGLKKIGRIADTRLERKLG